MPVKKVSITEFIFLSKSHPVLDVRSPGEFTHAHIPSANNLPLFSDEERKVVGTTYKQQGKQKAIKLGLDFFGVKMKSMVEEAESIIKRHNPQRNILLVHCWRGGMRSAGVAWLLDLYGFEVYILVGGYKAYRKWVLSQFEKPYQINVIGGYTGSAKTEIIQTLESSGVKAADLEGIANHKGSAFGAIGLPPQPTQEMFENILALKLFTLTEENNSSFWIEDESQRIGVLNIPHPLWKTIRKSRVYFMDIPFEKRLEHICASYGKHEKEKLVNAVMRIQKRFGPNETKTAINFLLEDNIIEAFALLLKYYDKTYIKSLHNREGLADLLHIIPSGTTNPEENTKTLLSFHND